MNRINICISCDDNYSQYAGVAITSILKNAHKDDLLYFYILEQNISELNKRKILELKKIKDFQITFITPNVELFLDYKNLYTMGHITLPSYFRLKMPSLLPELDKVLYLDCDIIVRSSLRDLYNIDLGGYFCAGAIDIGNENCAKNINLDEKQFYINSGVLLIDLKKWRENGVEDAFLAYAKENFSIIKLGDQDVMNGTLQGKILKLDSIWNFQVVNFYVRTNCSRHFNILHYIGASKPWKYASLIPMRYYYFNYLKYTSWEKPSLFWHLKSVIISWYSIFKHRPLYMFKSYFYKVLIGFFHT